MVKNPFSRGGKNTNNGDSSSKKKNGKAGESKGQLYLALIIIVGAFIFIACMLAIHYLILTQVISPNKVTDKNVTAMMELIDRVDTSNQTIFNILLPVFGAWVGVVVAFYYGSEQAKKGIDALSAQAESSQKALVDAYDVEREKLSKIKVQTLLETFPNTKKVHRVTLTDATTVEHAIKSFGEFSDIVIVNENDNPLGILYKQDLYGALNDTISDLDDQIKGIKKRDQIDQPLGEILGNIKAECIKGAKWDSQKGWENFATTTPCETLWDARLKMYGCSRKINDVRCIVIDDTSTNRVIAIFSYDSILYFVK